MLNTMTNRQMVFIILLSLTSYNVITIPKEMAASAGTGSWLVIFIASVIFGLFAVIITSLGNRFQGRIISEYSAQLISRPGAMVLSFAYVAYFLFLAVFLVATEAKVLQSAFFPKMPFWAFPLFSIPVFCFIANKGITTIARLCELVGILFFCTGTLVHLIMLTEGEPNHILPLFNAAEINDYLMGLIKTVGPFTPLSVLLAIPFTKKNGKKSKKAAFFTIIAIGLFYILIVLTSIMKVGINNIVHYEDALIIAIRDTSPEFLEVLARLDILFLTVGFAGLFMGIAIILTAIVEIFCRIFKRAGRPVVVAIMGTVIFLLCLVTDGIKDYTQAATKIKTLSGFVLSMFIPLALLIIAKIKNPKSKEKHSA